MDDSTLFLRDICTTHLIVVLETTPLSDAVRQMREARVSALVVARGRLPVGLITERDVVRLALESASSNDKRPVSTVMSSPLITASSELEYHRGYHLLISHKIRHLVVVDQRGALFGIASESDFVQHLGIEYLLEVKNVDDVMKRSLVVCPVGTPLNEAIAQLIQFSISCLLIGTAERIEGIITERDVVGLLVDEKLCDGVIVDDVMTSPVCAVTTGTPLDEARQLMKSRRIRRLLVVDEHESPVGLLTRQSLIGGIEKRYVELLTDSYLRTSDELHSVQMRLAEQRYARVLEHLAGIMLKEQGNSEQLLRAVMNELRFVLGADRAWLLAPLNSETGEISVVYESCSEDWTPVSEYCEKGVVVADRVLHDELLGLLCRAEPVTILRQPGAVFENLHQRWQIRSSLSIPVRASHGRAWLLEVHDCGKDRHWSPIDQNLLKDVSAHLSAALTNQHLLKQLEEDIRLRTAVEQRLENLIDTVPHGILEADMDGRISFTNRACCTIYGYAAQEMQGTLLWQFDCEAADSRLLKQALLEGNLQVRAERGIVRQQRRIDGALIWTRTDWSYRYGEDGRVAGLIAVITDITAEQESRLQLEEKKDFLESILNGLPDALVIADAERRIIRTNPGLKTLFGYDEAELVGRKTSVLYADQGEFTRQGRIRFNVDSPVQLDPYRSHYKRRDGSLFPAETVGYPIRDGSGEFLGFVGLIRDLTSVQNAEKAQIEASLRLQLAARGAGIGIWDLDVASNELVWDEQMFRLYGIAPENFGGEFSAWQRLVVEEDLGRATRELNVALSGESEFNTEFRIRRLDDEVRNIKAMATVQRNEAGEPVRVIGTNWDVTTERHAEQTVKHQAYHDILTGLPNRLLLQDRLQQVLAASARSGAPGCLLFVDLDHFKNINDAFGHSMGDRLLIAVADRIKGMIREGDTFARLGGDEFVILLNQMQPSGIAVVCQKIIAVLGDPFNLDQHRFFVRASIGVAIFPGDGQDPDTLLKHADAAMYKAKGLGRGTCAFYDQELSRLARQRIELEQELLDALDKRQLRVYYQPQFQLCADREAVEIVGAEALVRWQHPRLGLVAPDQFIPVAEEIGLIRSIDRYVLAEAIDQGVEWKRAGLLKGHISVNVSLSTPDSLNYPEEIISRFRQLSEEFDDGLITLEITESHLMSNTGSTVPELERLKQLNLRISVDDFGTGYSSLSYLTRLPVDILKVDQSFVRDIEHDPNDRAIIRAVLAMAEELQLQVVAEGVENEQQRQFLLRNGCQMGQGYMVARPMPADDIGRFLAEAAGSTGLPA